jgi:menaquinone-dependent protoporphyrinogen IX oxidase
MRIEIFHASKYGNGEKVAAYLQGILTAKGYQASLHHVKEIKPNAVSAADLYVFCSPPRIGKPIGKMKRFLNKVTLPEGSKFALIATQMQAKPNKKTGEMPSSEEIEKFQRCLPIMEEILVGKGMVKVAASEIAVTGLKGPLEEGWEKKVEAFATLLS